MSRSNNINNYNKFLKTLDSMNDSVKKDSVKKDSSGVSADVADNMITNIGQTLSDLNLNTPDSGTNGDLVTHITCPNYCDVLNSCSHVNLF